MTATGMNRPARSGDRDERIRELHRHRPRDRFVRGSLAMLAVAVTASWLLPDLDWNDLLSARRRANLERFAGELRPFPLQGQSWSWTTAWTWGQHQLDDAGFAAARASLAISILAIVLAGIAGLAFSLPAARSFARADVFLPEGRSPPRHVRWAWTLALSATRTFLIFLRAIPEYVWAFLLLGILGPSAWAAILALAIHNAGILGRLGSETVENAETRDAEALRAVGASRMQIAIHGLYPALLPRLLLYFFYRWETCVREATVLGMLGIVSLGYWIEDARTRGHYDTLALAIVVCVALVMLGDLVSSLARAIIRRSTA